MSIPKDTFWEQYGHFVGCTVRESNSAVGIVTGVTNDGEPLLHIRRRNGKIDKRKPSDVHKTCACGKRALDSNGKVCPGHENCKPLASAPPEPEDCPLAPHNTPLNYCPSCSWMREPSRDVSKSDEFQKTETLKPTEATLAEKLRSWGKAASPHGTEWAVTNVTEFSTVLLEAADHIDTLTAENKRLSDLCDKHAGKNLLR